MARRDFWDNNSRDDYNSRDGFGGYRDVDMEAVAGAGVGAFMTKVFGWMFLGLLVTAGAAFAFLFAVVSSPAVNTVASNPIFLFALIIAEVVAVMAISFGLRSMSASLAKILFIVYSALNGVTLSYACAMYTGASVAQAFLMAAVFFGIMAFYGGVTRSDLTRFGPILMAALITLIIMTVINMFLGSGMLDYILCLVGLGIFAGLTAYDVQKIKSIYYGAAAGGGEMAQKISIIGALTLYLDFINMFLYLLRLLGKRD